MRSAGWLLGCLVIAVFIVITVITQLNTDASPAAAICAKEQRQGIDCRVGQRYDAQVILVTDPMGGTAGYLVVSEGTKVVGTIPLQ